jgi:hypothetical protein
MATPQQAHTVVSLSFLHWLEALGPGLAQGVAQELLQASSTCRRGTAAST